MTYKASAHSICACCKRTAISSPKLFRLLLIFKAVVAFALSYPKLLSNCEEKLWLAVVQTARALLTQSNRRGVGIYHACIMERPATVERASHQGLQLMEA